MTNVRIINLKSEFYLLIENELIYNRFNKSINSLVDIFFSSYRSPRKDKELSILKDVVELSYLLLKDFDIQITKLNPFYLFLCIENFETDSGIENKNCLSEVLLIKYLEYGDFLGKYNDIAYYLIERYSSKLVTNSANK